MKYAIVFSSQTGNTKQLAEAVSSVLPQADLCFFGSPSQEALQAERLFIGFWTDKGRCNQEITDFLKTLKCKEVFLFGTAGFGGSQEYFDKILSSVQKRLGASNTVIGTYMCQGKMPQSVRERYVKMKNSPLPIPNVDKMIENFDTAVFHPDETDLQKLKYAVAQCIKCCYKVGPKNTLPSGCLRTGAGLLRRYDDPLFKAAADPTLLSGILMTALVSGILQCVLFPSSALLGSSGIVFMLIMLSSLAGSRNGGIPITLILVGALYLSQQVYDILFVQDNVANFMHIVGGACGTVFGFAVRRK